MTISNKDITEALETLANKISQIEFLLEETLQRCEMLNKPLELAGKTDHTDSLNEPS